MLTQEEQGRLLYELIRSKGFNQLTFSLATGYPRSCLSRLCRGERPISGVGVKTIISFTNVLQLTNVNVFCKLVGIDLEKTNDRIGGV